MTWQEFGLIVVVMAPFGAAGGLMMYVAWSIAVRASQHYDKTMERIAREELEMGITKEPNHDH